MTSGPHDDELLRVSITGEPDVFVVRQRGREVAGALGLESQDQIRVATVLSDLGRDFVRHSIGVTVTFALRSPPSPALVIEFMWRGDALAQILGAGLATAGRLMDHMRSTHVEGKGTIVLIKNRPAALPPVDAAALARTRANLTSREVTTAYEELQAQNHELLDTLEALEAKRRDLARLNDELEETNQGVVALYKELSEELEQTNQGVVALYAELNEKSVQLKAASEAKTRFWSNVSHELRGPINSVVGLARLLAAPDSDPLTDEQRRQVKLVNDSGDTLLALVNELLDTAKAESGRLVPQPTPVDLAAVFRQLRGGLRAMTHSPDVTLVVDEPPASMRMVTDETMLVRILRNLLSNGLKFTMRGEVRLSVEPGDTDETLKFVVADTGIGIPGDQQERVFEEFHQVRNELQTRAGGTGLGLPYARRLAEILGGSLTLRSEIGRGTEMSLVLPARDARHRTPSILSTVLLVDDDDEFRARLAGLVDDLAHTIIEVPNGREALDSIADRRPDLVFLDLYMPVMNGREVLGVLREKAGLADIPVVVLTSAAPDGLDLSGTGLAAALLLKSQLSAESIRLAMGEAFMAVPRTVNR